MLLRKPIMIYYFSGTGNTLLVARKIFTSGVVELKDDCYLGIVVPVAMQSTFPIVWEFIERLPEGNMRQVFMADTMETFPGGIVGPMKKSLKSKGYRCIGACEFRMASSMQMTEKRSKSEERKMKWPCSRHKKRPIFALIFKGKHR